MVGLIIHDSYQELTEQFEDMKKRGLEMSLLTEEEIRELEGMALDSLEVESEETVFVIKDLNGLNWTFRKMAALKKKIAEVKELEKQEIERIKSWAKNENVKYENSELFFKAKITQYHQEQLELDPKAKTISTPYGKAKSTARKATPEKLDDKMILRHVISNELPYTKPTLEWGELKKTLKVVEIDGVSRVHDENGVEVMGIGVTEAGITFGVEVSEI